MNQMPKLNKIMRFDNNYELDLKIQQMHTKNCWWKAIAKTNATLATKRLVT